MNVDTRSGRFSIQQGYSTASRTHSVVSPHWQHSHQSSEIGRPESHFGEKWPENDEMQCGSFGGIASQLGATLWTRDGRKRRK